MQIIISGKHIDIGDALRSYVEESIHKNVKKYFENAINAHVTISKKGHFFNTDLIVNEGTGSGVIIKGNSSEDDAYVSVDSAVSKVEKQLRRYKNKIKHHHHTQKDSFNEFEHLSATSHVLTPFPWDVEIEVEAEAPVIVAEKAEKMEKLSVSDAVMKMDLLDLQAMLFINSSTKRINMIHYRQDGNIAWVDTNVSA